ncbi:MAG: hypothetical protein UX79_C0017G0008 [candidate division WWE3 bacterium GW2011_GWB1_47_11]|uniref:Glycosyltransferase RgtA/B/C/D-like domain-containing protein n=1 Tax=candidate division WWE3 bacterium GW2011_GWB1_47_11 TaxID=1619117 RepID=A0A0G1RIW4_UNCKA|nr:MAG: hypothetical protein UX79_C0017G0008 [candidate division WWE3 bacterium GW2011_GWB1_47_11]
MGTKKLVTIIAVITLAGALLRLYHIDFGLPHSLQADEPELGEFAIKYTYEIKSIIAGRNWYKLIPLNFVYGTFPIYVYTAAMMAFSKALGLLGVAFDRVHIYTYLRVLTALASLTAIPAAAFLYNKLFKDWFGTLVTAMLVALNWQFIVLGHYLNADIIVATLLSLAYITAYLYYARENDTKYTILTGILLGFAMGTKVTAAISLPLFLYIYASKKDWREMGGIVFDSVDSNPFKYVLATGYIATPLAAVLAMVGVRLCAPPPSRHFHHFLIGHVLLYLIFFSLGNRRVDRWMLPVLPIMLIYTAYGLAQLKEKLGRIQFVTAATIVALSYLYFPALLLVQFQRQTPKSAAYLWMRDNLAAASNKLVITEQGLDPMNKLPSVNVRKSVVYSSENAQLVYPESPVGYNYIAVSSRPMANFKRPEIQKAYPEYVKRWQAFESELMDPSKYELVKTFELPKPNLIPLSDVYIYKNIELQ